MEDFFILAIIGIVLSSLYLVFTIYMKINFTDEEMKGIQENLMEKIKQQQEQE